MSERKNPIEQALEFLVYAPLGLALTARDNLPALIDKGRQQLTTQMTLAKMMGQFAVAEGDKEMRKRVEQVGEVVGGLVNQAGASPAPASAVATPSADAEGPAPETAGPGAPSTASAGDAGSNGKVSPPTGASTSGSHLAITGYDTLSASQVVQRLAGLAAEELEAVRLYEEHTRGRRTILSKIGQLQAGSGS